MLTELDVLAGGTSLRYAIAEEKHHSPLFQPAAHLLIARMSQHTQRDPRSPKRLYLTVVVNQDRWIMPGIAVHEFSGSGIQYSCEQRDKAVARTGGHNAPIQAM